MATAGYTEISWEDIKLGKEITSKESSRRNRVYEAMWTTSEGGQKVAAKYCMNFKAEEAKILAKLEHKNIIKFYGVAKVIFLPDTYVIVTEFAEKGSLYSFIGLHRDTWQEFKQPYWMKWAREGAEALQFIHEQKYQHGDVKSPNFVITTNDTLKICDFGTARGHIHTVSTLSVRGSWPWMAPEVMGKPTDTKFKVTVKADVFSYAVVFWELITGEIPYKGQSHFEIYKTVSEDRKCLEIPSDCPEHLRQLLLACWDHDYVRRPSMNEVLKCLELKTTPSDLSPELPAEKADHFQTQQHPTSASMNSRVSEKDLSWLASKMGSEWEQVGIQCLGLTNNDIFHCKTDEKLSVRSQIFSMFYKWMCRAGSAATYSNLITKLAKFEDFDGAILDELKKRISTST